jgi:hypothetical protein
MFATAGAMVIAPLLFYLYRIWATRRDKLFSYLDAKSLVLSAFFPQVTMQVKAQDAPALALL